MGLEPAKSCWGCPGTLGAVICWAVAGLALLLFRTSDYYHDQCESDCGVNCYSSGVPVRLPVPIDSEVKRICGGVGEACFSNCANLQDYNQLFTELNRCMESECTDVCPVPVKPTLPGAGEPAIPPIDFMSNSTACSQCRASCEESSGIEEARQKEAGCVREGGCQQIAANEWSEAERCAEENQCDAKGFLSQGDLGRLMQAVIFTFPILATLCCATYKESVECESPQTWSVCVWAGRCSCAIGTAGALFILGAVTQSFAETSSAASLALFLVALFSCFYNAGACLLVVLSRCCFAYDSGQKDEDARAHRLLR